MTAMEKLRNYMTEKSITEAELAAEVGVNQSTIHRLARGQFVPRVDLANKIRVATKGRIRFLDWVMDGKNGVGR